MSEGYVNTYDQKQRVEAPFHIWVQQVSDMPTFDVRIYHEGLGERGYVAFGDMCFKRRGELQEVVFARFVRKIIGAYTSLGIPIVIGARDEIGLRDFYRKVVRYYAHAH